MLLLLTPTTARVLQLSHEFSAYSIDATRNTEQIRVNSDIQVIFLAFNRDS